MDEEKKSIGVLLDKDASLPFYASDGASGADVYAHVTEEVIVFPGQSTLIPTGLYLEIPEGYEMQIRSRSGLALHHQVIVLNAPGTIDSDYRGEVKIVLINHGRREFVIKPKMRIAQIVLTKFVRAHFVPRMTFSSTTFRGEGGFGHSGW